MASGLQRDRLTGRLADRAALGSALALAVLALAPTDSTFLATARALLMVTAVGSLGIRLVDRFGLGESRSARALFAAVLGSGAAVAWATWLGAFGALRPRPFLVGLALAAAAADLARRPGGSGPAAGSEPPPTRDRGIVGIAIAAVVVTFLVHDARQDRYAPPGKYHYDDLSFHLPAAATWARTGDLRMLRFEVGDPSTTFYPVGSELASWMLSAPLPGSDFLARWSQLPAAAVFLLGVWAVARLLGSGPLGAGAAVLLTLSVPRLFPAAALSAGNDLWSATWIVAAFATLIELRRRPGPAPAILTGVACGLLVGTKYLGLLSLPWLAISAVLIAGRSLRAAGWRSCLRWSAGALLAAFAVGGFTYLRNAVATGNPVYPQPVRVGGVSLLDGLERADLGSRRQSEGAIGDPVALLSSRADQLGEPLGRLLLPLALALPALVIGLRRRLPSGSLGPLLALSLALAWQVAIFTWAVHDQRDVRYIYAAPACAAIGMAALASCAPRRTRYVLLGGLAAWALVGAASAREGIEPAVAALALLSAVAVVGTRRPGRRVPAALALGLLASFGLAAAVPKYQARRLRHWPLAELIERESGGPTIVAYAAGNQPYRYTGRSLENRVELVSIRPGAPTTDFVGWRLEPLRGRRARPGTFVAWNRNLHALGVEWVVLGGGRGAAPYERWMGFRPRRFRRVGSDGDAQVWRVRPAGRPPKRGSGLDRGPGGARARLESVGEEVGRGAGVGVEAEPGRVDHLEGRARDRGQLAQNLVVPALVRDAGDEPVGAVVREDHPVALECDQDDAHRLGEAGERVVRPQAQALAHPRRVGVGRRAGLVARRPDPGQVARHRDREAQRVPDLAGLDFLEAREPGQKGQPRGVGGGPAVGAQGVRAEVVDRARGAAPARR